MNISIAISRAAIKAYLKHKLYLKYSDDQPRDDAGRWTSGGGGGGGITGGGDGMGAGDNYIENGVGTDGTGGKSEAAGWGVTAFSTAEELEAAGYVAVYRGTNADGVEAIRVSETGMVGSGIYFYTSAIPAASYAEQNGGIVSAYVHPFDMTTNDPVPGREYNLVVVRNPRAIIRRGIIPSENTRDKDRLKDLSEQSLDVVWNGYEKCIKPIKKTSLKTAAAYELHVWSYMREFFTGGVDAFGFIDLMAEEIDNQYWRGWREGAEIMGVYPEDFTDDDNAVIESMIGNEQDYLDGIAGDIEAFIAEGEHTDAEFAARFRSRAALWARGYQAAVDQAKLHFGAKDKLEWILGESEQSCTTCLALNGVVAWAQEWAEAEVMPGASNLACGGWQCHCQLLKTDKRRTSGGLSKILDIMTSARV